LEYFTGPSVVVDEGWAYHEVIFIVVNWVNGAVFVADVYFVNCFVAFLFLGHFQQALAQFHAVYLLEAISLEIVTNITLTASNI